MKEYVYGYKTANATSPSYHSFLENAVLKHVVAMILQLKEKSKEKL